MVYGASMKARTWRDMWIFGYPDASAVDYILFLTADVDVTPNLNEIRDYKYVDKEELQKMFDDPCEF